MPRQGGLNTWLTVTGVFLALFCGCGLVTLLWPESSLTFKAGGLLGLMMAKAMVAVLGDFGSTVALFCGFFAGLTLILDISWLRVVDKVGEWAIALFEKVMGDPDEALEGEKKQSRLKMPKMPKISLPKRKAATDAAAKEEINVATPVVAEANTTAKPAAQPATKTAAPKNTAKKLSIAAAVAGVGALVSRKDSAKNEAAEEMVINVEDHDEDDEIPTIREVVSAPSEPLSAPPVKITKPAPAPVAKAAPQDDFDDEEEYLSPVALPQKQVAAAKKAAAAAPAAPVQKPRSNHSSEKLGLLPPLELLEPAPTNQDKFSEEQLDDLANSIQTTLADYGIHGVEVVDRFPGPVVTRFEIDLPPGTKVSRISGLAKDIARSMRVPSIRIVEVIPGKTTIGIEIPNDTRELVAISEILNAPIYQQSKSPLTIAMGKTIAGNPAIADLAKMPHVLVAGTTGSGKSVAVNAMIMSLLYKSSPEQVKLILIDPKMLELSIYEGIPHLLTSVVTDMKDAANALRWCVGEMERRYAAMSYMKVRNIAGYNQKVQEAIDRGEPITDPSFDPTKHVDVQPSILEPYPYIVVVIDEFADMIMVVGKKVEELIARLAQKARASGIHLILATQRPSVDVITGLIKANIPSRIAFQVSTKVDSRTILDQGGAEQLLGNGDMLYMPPGTGLPQRIHGAFVSDEEVEVTVNYLKEHGEPKYLDDVLVDTGGAGAPIPGLEPLADSEGDELYDQGVSIVTESRRASISYLQRRLKIGYNRAASMIEDMEKAGVVSEVQSNGTREVLAPPPVKD